MAETANPYVEGYENPIVPGSFDVEQNQAGAVAIAEQEQEQDTTSRDLDIKKIRENAETQRNLYRLQQILDEIRTERAREIDRKDIDATGERRNGLFGWRALRRSYEGFIKNIVNASGDMSKAQERLDSELMAQDNPENLSTADRALEAFGQTCDQSQKQELTELMGMISDRYALEKQNGNATSEVMRKIEQTIMANSALLNMAIGAVFRTAFRSISHVGGLSGALLTSAIYGGASSGLRERRKARQEELSASAWKQELEGLETPEQKLGLLRQIAENPAKFRTYFEGRSAEAFEFFLLYQQTLSETDLESILEDAPPNIREIYAGKKIGARTLVAAGRGALRSMTLSGIGYAITHGLSSLAHGELAMAQEGSGGDAKWESQQPKYPITWREHLDQSPQTPRLELNDRGRFETGSDQYAEVEIQGVSENTEGELSSASNVAREIAKNLGKAGRPGEMQADLQITNDQQTQIEEHITQYLKNKNIDYSEGETIHVPASEINRALDEAHVRISDSLTYQAPETPEAEAGAPAQEPATLDSTEGAPAEGEEAPAAEEPAEAEGSPAEGGPVSEGNEGASQADNDAGMGEGASEPITGQGEGEDNGGTADMESKEVDPQQESGEPLADEGKAGKPAEADEEKNWKERFGSFVSRVAWPETIGLGVLAVLAIAEWKRGWKDVQTIKRGLGGVAERMREKIKSTRSGLKDSEESQETETDLAIQFSNELLSEIEDKKNEGFTAVLWLGTGKNQGLYEVTGKSKNQERPLLVRSLKSDSKECDHVVGRQIDDEDRWLLVKEDELFQLKSLSDKNPEKALEEFKKMHKEAETEDDSDDADKASVEERNDSEAGIEVSELEPITDPKELRNYCHVYVLPVFKNATRSFGNGTIDLGKIYGMPITFEKNYQTDTTPYILTPPGGSFFFVEESDLETFFGTPKKDDRVLDVELDNDLDDDLPSPEPALPANTGPSSQQPAEEEAPEESDKQPAQDTETGASVGGQPRANEGPQPTSDRTQQDEAPEENSTATPPAEADTEAQPEDIKKRLDILENIPSNIFNDANLTELNTIAHEIYNRSIPNDPEKEKLINMVYAKIFTGYRVTRTSTEGPTTIISSAYQPRPFIIERPNGDKTLYQPTSPQNVENQIFTTRTIGSGESGQAKDGEEVNAETLKNRILFWNTWHDIRPANAQERREYR